MKKIIIVIIALLLVCDITLMITANAQQGDSDADLQQLRQLQQLNQRTPAPNPATDVIATVPTATMPPAPIAPIATTTPAPNVLLSPQQPVAPTQALTPNPTTRTVIPPTIQYGTTRPGQQDASSPSSEMGQKAMDERAFREVVRNLMPLTPEQIVRLRAKYNSTELAKVTTPDAPPKPVASTQIVQLAPGSTPPVVRLSKGYVSSVVFLDSTGAPWPIQDYDLGDPNAFNIQWDKTSNTLMIQAKQLYTYGNLAVRLQGLHTPVMLTLVPGQEAVDYRADLRIRGYGPNAKAIPVQTQPESADQALLSILDGVPPNGGKQLDVVGGDAQVWVTDDVMYVRTRLKILSPGWLAYMSSADGMQVYKMQQTSMLLVSLPELGKTTNLKITGW